MTIVEYVERTGTTLTALFIKAYQDQVYPNMTREEHMDVQRDIERYRKLGEIPIYISLFLSK